MKIEVLVMIKIDKYLTMEKNTIRYKFKPKKIFWTREKLNCQKISFWEQKQLQYHFSDWGHKYGCCYVMQKFNNGEGNDDKHNKIYAKIMVNT